MKRSLLDQLDAVIAGKAGCGMDAAPGGRSPEVWARSRTEREAREAEAAGGEGEPTVF